MNSGNHEPPDGRHNPHITIILNGRPRHVEVSKLCFEGLVELAFPGAPVNENTAYTVAYSRGPKENRDGGLVEGGCVELKSGMVFNVQRTDKS